jgi:hypothetical protein
VSLELDRKYSLYCLSEHYLVRCAPPDPTGAPTGPPNAARSRSHPVPVPHRVGRGLLYRVT